MMQVKANAAALGAALMKHGYKLITDGTDNHLVLWDLKKEVRTLTHHCSACVRDMCADYLVSNLLEAPAFEAVMVCMRSIL